MDNIEIIKLQQYFDERFPGLRERLIAALNNLVVEKLSRSGIGVSNRSHPQIEEQLTTCQLCDYPLSERHHLLPFAEFGENDSTIQLCPNCHNFYHIVWRALIENNPLAHRIVEKVLGKIPHLQFYGVLYLVHTVQDAQQIWLNQKGIPKQEILIQLALIPDSTSDLPQ